MCDFDCANLIDLTLEDDIQCTSKTQIKTEETPLGRTEGEGLPLFVSPTRRKRDSLENNPFDCVQKLAQRQYDPFDIVEREACLKARNAIKPINEIKLGNLLSLSDDNLLEDEPIPSPVAMPLPSNVDEAGFNSNATNLYLDSESPPVLFNEKLPPDSASDTDSTNPNSSAESSASSKLKKAMEYRKRLLKLSLSNAAFNSPVARKTSLDGEERLGTPISSIFSRSTEFGENLLSAESPLKLVDDDIMSEEPPSFLDSEKKFEADLEMLKIHNLNDLPSPEVEKSSILRDINTPECNLPSSANLATSLSNLEIIKAKLKAKREETNNNHQLEISSLIDNLKSLIAGGEMTSDNKKQQASDLLESLSSALSTTNPEETLKPQDLLALPPQPIKRQGTFDIELQDNEEDKQPLVQEMPNCMISSSATYDGETEEEKQHLNLPEIAPITPQSSPPLPHRHHGHQSENHLQSDVNDIMEQLSKLIINNSSSDKHQNTHNPTFIVVMNSNQMSHNSHHDYPNVAAAKQRSAMVASYMENSFNDGSPDLTKVNPMQRRRSQSLSIHDKVKIVQLPLQPPTPRSIQRQQHVQSNDSPPVVTTPPPCDMGTPEFKTPARLIRRNSYSTGTPYTAQVGVRRTGFGSDGKNPSHLRRAQTLDTHHEGKQQQQQAIVRPMSMPANNLATFKPDLKKKLKHNTESIMKSSGPLKATIPVKKVAPMIKTSPPTPEHGIKLPNHHNTSLQNLPKTSKMPTTPMPAKGKSTLGVGVGYPNACSTPAGLTSPMKRTGGPLNKPKYSYMSTTPNNKPASTSAAAASLKRRTITEFKAKSPLKSRVSSVGLAAAAAAVSTSSRPSTGSSRLSTSAGARISKTPVKPTSNTATVRPTSRLGSRISVGVSALTTRNKENKRP